jgi:signal transduction histidine kinase
MNQFSAISAELLTLMTLVFAAIIFSSQRQSRLHLVAAFLFLLLGVEQGLVLLHVHSALSSELFSASAFVLNGAVLLLLITFFKEIRSEDKKTPFWQEWVWLLFAIILLLIAIAPVAYPAFAIPPARLSFLLIPHFLVLLAMLYYSLFGKSPNKPARATYSWHEVTFIVPLALIAFVVIRFFSALVALPGLHVLATWILLLLVAIWFYRSKRLPRFELLAVFYLVLVTFYTFLMAVGEGVITMAIFAVAEMRLLVAIGMAVFALLVWLLAKRLLGIDRQRHSGRKVGQFVADLYKNLTRERFGPYVCNFIIQRFGRNKVALIGQTEGNEPFEIISQVNFSMTELQQLLKDPSLRWFEQLRRPGVILTIEQISGNTNLQAAFREFHIGAVLVLKQKAEILGMLLIADDQSLPLFTKSELEELELIAGQLSLAIEQISLTRRYYETEKMAEIGALSSQVAHDFRSFLSVVQLDPDTTPMLKDMARQTGAMIQDMLTFVRPDELTLMPTDINALLKSSMQMLTIPDKVQIEKNFVVDLPEINADMNQMQRVFINLINNAVRAVMAKDGGRIKLSTKRLRTFQVFAEAEWIYVEILDEGEGIPEANLSKIFKPFFTSYKDRGGSGLGLSIVKKIIEAHGGVIDVTSVVGRGTAFNIRLPIRGQLSFEYT